MSDRWTKVQFFIQRCHRVLEVSSGAELQQMDVFFFFLTKRGCLNKPTSWAYQRWHFLVFFLFFFGGWFPCHNRWVYFGDILEGKGFDLAPKNLEFYMDRSSTVQGGHCCIWSLGGIPCIHRNFLASGCEYPFKHGEVGYVELSANINKK